MPPQGVETSELSLAPHSLGYRLLSTELEETGHYRATVYPEDYTEISCEFWVLEDAAARPLKERLQPSPSPGFGWPGGTYRLSKIIRGADMYCPLRYAAEFELKIS